MRPDWQDVLRMVPTKCQCRCGQWVDNVEDLKAHYGAGHFDDGAREVDRSRRVMQETNTPSEPVNPFQFFQNLTGSSGSPDFGGFGGGSSGGGGASGGW